MAAPDDELARTLLNLQNPPTPLDIMSLLIRICFDTCQFVGWNFCLTFITRPSLVHPFHNRLKFVYVLAFNLHDIPASYIAAPYQACTYMYRPIGPQSDKN